MQYNKDQIRDMFVTMDGMLGYVNDKIDDTLDALKVMMKFVWEKRAGISFDVDKWDEWSIILADIVHEIRKQRADMSGEINYTITKGES